MRAVNLHLPLPLPLPLRVSLCSTISALPSALLPALITFSKTLAWFKDLSARQLFHHATLNYPDLRSRHRHTS